MVPSPPSLRSPPSPAGWRVGSPRPASPLLLRPGDEVIAPLRGTRSRCPARSVPAPLPAPLTRSGTWVSRLHHDGALQPVECAVRRCLLLLPWLTGAGAGEGAARGPGSLRPAGCDGYRSPRASPQGCAGRARGEGRGRGRSKLTSGYLGRSAGCGSRGSFLRLWTARDVGASWNWDSAGKWASSSLLWGPCC